ncbi:MAG: hypothetical protein ETSY1_18285 [Candidatus Entotheonella factor]|uniref:Uncharacterized protein n=1 Tax=Entotheonella factor TaxID=1429438 RepID=W4LKE5_ENTF1|nr:hypothetical protein [Candidatus Entotheonella palauensis]ETW98578.1 MAG: hypothetical protein ETSY1_18285 [Candidatus Entotheonella factor]
MLNASQQAQLEALVKDMADDLYVEEASLNAQHTLEVVLCREMICFRPVRITMQEVDVTAALDGQAEAQHALQAHLRQAMHGML